MYKETKITKAWVFASLVEPHNPPPQPHTQISLKIVTSRSYHIVIGVALLLFKTELRTDIICKYKYTVCSIVIYIW